GEGMLVVDVYLVTGARQLLRRRQARRPGTDDRNLLAGLLLGRLGRNPALGKGLVGDAAFDGLDRHRLVVDVERAGGLTWRRTDAAGNLGKIVGRMQIARRRPPLLAVDQIVPVRDLIVYGTAVVTVGNAAVHAARCLHPGVRLRQRQDEFAPML